MSVFLTVSALESIAQLITALLVFAFVLLITWAATRWVGNNQKMQLYCKNIEVIETFKVTTNKYIQIVRTGDKYLAIAVCKESITMLAELDGECLTLSESDSTKEIPFGEILEKVKGRIQKK